MIRDRNTSHRLFDAARIRKPISVPIWLTISNGFRPMLSESFPRIGPAISWQNA